MHLEGPNLSQVGVEGGGKGSEMVEAHEVIDEYMEDNDCKVEGEVPTGAMEEEDEVKAPIGEAGGAEEGDNEVESELPNELSVMEIEDSDGEMESRMKNINNVVESEEVVNVSDTSTKKLPSDGEKDQAINAEELDDEQVPVNEEVVTKEKDSGAMVLLRYGVGIVKKTSDAVNEGAAKELVISIEYSEDEEGSSDAKEEVIDADNAEELKSDAEEDSDTEEKDSDAEEEVGNLSRDSLAEVLERILERPAANRWQEMGLGDRKEVEENKDEVEEKPDVKDQLNVKKKEKMTMN